MSDTQPFLLKLAQKLVEKSKPLHQIAVILPSRRGELYLKKYLAELLDKPALAPKIITIENWVIQVSGLMPVGGIDLYFKAYQEYLKIDLNPESFEEFLKWIPSVLHDFNEVDRHMVRSDDLFENMVDAKTIENWGVSPGKSTDLIEHFLQFWRRLKPLYSRLTQKMLEEKTGWQGLAYRRVAENLDSIAAFNHKNQIEHTVFAGFNALNKAEISIVNHLLDNNSASIYWDADEYYLNNPIQEAGMFMRTYKSKWSHFNKHSFNTVGNLLDQKKKIFSYGVSGPISQAKKVGEILNNIEIKDASKVAVVLADEQLLIPVLNAVPETFDKVNITMGVGIHQIPITHFTLQYLQLCAKLQKEKQHKIYFKDLKSLFDHKVMAISLNEDVTVVEQLFAYIKDQNLAFLAEKDVLALEGELGIDLGLIKELYQCHDPKLALDNIEKHLMFFAGSGLQNRLEKETIYQLILLIHQLQEALEQEDYVQNFETCIELYRQLLSEIQLTFYGEPLSGLQVMGLLETRTLDFDTIIMTSVNEGILPSGKSQNSFIPFDMRRYFGLPVHTEKDAVYAYHFFRLIQRAKEVHLISSTVSKGLGSGERSRFIFQIDSEMKNVDFQSYDEGIVIDDTSLSRLTAIKKSPSLISHLKALMKRGLSPTSFASYVNNPMEFYLNKVLGVREENDVEEVVGYSTLGTVIHEVLETFYTPFINGFPGASDFVKMRTEVDNELRIQFSKHFKQGRLDEGKNLLIFKVAFRMINRFLDWDEKNGLAESKKGTPIKIIDLEKEVRRSIYVKELDLNVNFVGKIDRLEQCGDELRIIDYKTGAVSSRDLNVNSLEDIIDKDQNKSKALQLMMYAYILNKDHSNVKAGIISLRKLSSGLMLSGMYINRNKSESISFGRDVLQEVEQLIVLKLCEMFDQSIDIQDYELLSLNDIAV